MGLASIGILTVLVCAKSHSSILSTSYFEYMKVKEGSRREVCENRNIHVLKAVQKCNVQQCTLHTVSERNIDDVAEVA